MSKWIEKFSAHPFYGVWKSLQNLLVDEEIDERLNDDSVQDVARLRKVISYLNGIIENIDPELTPFNHLTNIQNAAQTCFNELNAFKGNGNVAHLQNANN